MKYSFLMCVNKKHDFLHDAIESVLNQTDPDFLFYIIANNCSDDLWFFLSKYNDCRIKLFRTEIGQLSFNLNFGINLIRDGYMLRMDADDISEPDRLELTKNYLAVENWPDVMGGQATVIDECGKEIGFLSPPLKNAQIRNRLWRKNTMIHPTCAMKVESILKLRGYLGGFMSEDYDLWLRASNSKNFIFCNIDKPLLKYRINEGQSRSNVLGYSEVAGHLLREALLGNGNLYFIGSLIGVVKRLLFAKK